MDNIFELIDSLPKIDGNIFNAKFCPIIFNEYFDSYIINFKDIEFLSEINGLNYNENINLMLYENNILNENYLVAIHENIIYNNPEIINNIPNYIIIKESDYNLISRYINFILEQSDNVNDPYTFICEGIINNAYIDDFILQEINIIDTARNIGNTIKNNTQNNIIQPYRQGRDEHAANANRTTPNFIDRLYGVKNVAKETGYALSKGIDYLDDANVDYVPDFSGAISDGDPIHMISKGIGIVKYLSKPENKMYIKYKGTEYKDAASKHMAATNQKMHQLSDRIRSNSQAKINSLKQQISSLQTQLSQASTIDLKRSIQNKINALNTSIQQLLRSNNDK